VTFTRRRSPAGRKHRSAVALDPRRHFACLYMRSSLASGPSVASPSLDATLVMEPILAVLGQVGFPTDISGIGTTGGLTATNLLARRRYVESLRDESVARRNRLQCQNWSLKSGLAVSRPALAGPQPRVVRSKGVRPQTRSPHSASRIL